MLAGEWLSISHSNDNATLTKYPRHRKPRSFLGFTAYHIHCMSKHSTPSIPLGTILANRITPTNIAVIAPHPCKSPTKTRLGRAFFAFFPSQGVPGATSGVCRSGDP